MAKLGIYADPHFSLNSSIVNGKQNGFSSRLSNLIESFKWMNGLFEEHHVDTVICLGDLTDRPILSAEEITALSMCNLEDHYFIVGNHCRSDKDGKLNALSMFKHVFSSPETIEIDNALIHILPYNSDIYDLPEGVDIILSHNEIKNYNFGDYISTTGYEMTDILKSCKLFINGHLHNGSWVVKDRIINLGQLSGMNFSSTGGDWEPSVGILDTETLKLDLFENPVAYRFKKLECQHLPQLKSYLDNLPPTGQYVIQVKTTADVAEDCRKLLDQSQRVVASRILTVTPDVKKHSGNLDLKQLSSEGTVYDKFKAFLAEQPSLKFDFKKLCKIIDQLQEDQL